MVGVLLAFLLNLNELVFVEYSSALSLCVAGIVKLLLLIVLNSVVFSYPWTPYNIAGVAFSIIGVSGYNFVKLREKDTRPSYEFLENPPRSLN
jgi:hypothetical protein